MYKLHLKNDLYAFNSLADKFAFVNKNLSEF